MKCFECDDGILVKVVEVYNILLLNKVRFKVSDVPILCCNICGEKLIPAESSKLITEATKAFLGEKDYERMFPERKVKKYEKN